MISQQKGDNIVKWTIEDRFEGMIIKDYLQKVNGFSKRILKAVKFDGGGIIVNDQRVNVRYCLKSGDELEVIFPEERREEHMKGEEIPLHIIYEDEDVLVLEKPPGMLTIPSLKQPSGTLANGLIGYYQKNNIPYTVHVVTRLDKDTSGLLLVAKHRFSHSILSKDQKSNLLNRSYYAVIEGVMEREAGTIDVPIGRKQDSIIERAVTENGQHARTHFRVIKSSRCYSLVDVKLETGRTHQIRVHLSYLGFPLAGDDLYGGGVEDISRQALHCKSLAFTHPFTKERLEFSSTIPQEMENLLL